MSLWKHCTSEQLTKCICFPFMHICVQVFDFGLMKPLDPTLKAKEYGFNLTKVTGMQVTQRVNGSRDRVRDSFGRWKTNVSGEHLLYIYTLLTLLSLALIER